MSSGVPMAVKKIASESYGFLVSLWVSQGAVFFRNSLFSKMNSSSAIAAATVAPLNYAWLTIGSSCMRSSKNFYSSHEDLELGRRWRTALIYGLGVGLFFVVPAYLVSPYLMPLLQLGSASFHLAFRYNLISMISGPFRMIRTVDRHLFAKMNQHNLLIYLSLSQTVISCVASYFLNQIMPVEGIPIGQVLGAVLGFGIALEYLYRKSSPDYGLFKLGLTQANADCRKLVCEGLHNGISAIGENFANIGVMIMMSLCSKEALVANNIINQTMQIFITASYALGIGLQGALRIEKSNLAWKITDYFKGSLVLAVLVYCLSFPMIFLTQSIAGLFTDIHTEEGPGVVRTAEKLMRLSVFAGLLDHVRNITSGAQQFFEDTRFIMGATVICRGLIGTGLSFYLGFKKSLGAEGVLAGHLIGVGIGGCAQLFRFAWHAYKTTHPARSALPTIQTPILSSPAFGRPSSPASGISA